MARIKIELPENFIFSIQIPIRITDLNYGGHVGNDTILSLIHEARVQYLKEYGLEELKFGPAGLIMSDVAIEFKSELFYGDMVSISVTAGDFTNVSFGLFYKLEKDHNGKKVTAAIAKSGMVCYDYDLKKITIIPEEIKLKLSN